MKPEQIELRRKYQALINGSLMVVRMDAFNELLEKNPYTVTNIRTKKRYQIEASEFLGQLADPDNVPIDPKHIEQVSQRQLLSLADRLNQNSIEIQHPPHVMVIARAGTGKTTTLVGGLREIIGFPQLLTPSKQQAEVWKAMALSKGLAQSMCFVAFGRDIAKTLKEKVKPFGCEAMTLHGMGLRAITRGIGKLEVVENRLDNIIAELTGRDIWQMRRTDPGLVNTIKELVNLCKVNLVGVHLEGKEVRCSFTLDDMPSFTDSQDWYAAWEDALQELADRYELDTDGYDFAELVPAILDRCRNVEKDLAIDYSDEIWLPIVRNLQFTRYDLLLVDEAQDLNPCQHEICKRSGKRLILCGDDRQAIFGFAGAAADSIKRLIEELTATAQGCIVLPLTVTRRCAKAIVREAQKIVPDFEAFETNPEGKVWRATADNKPSGNQWSGSYHSFVQPGDAILCRVNAPLVSECFRFLKQNRKAEILGREIGEGLISTIKKVLKGYEWEDNPLALTELENRLEAWLHVEVAKEMKKKVPKEARIIGLHDRYSCLICFLEASDTVEEMIQRIATLFTDDRREEAIKLASLHKSKGLEFARVFFFEPRGAEVPHPMVKSEWQLEQEWNLRYVGITRAINELIYVS